MTKNVYYYVDEYNKETKYLIELFEEQIKQLKDNRLHVTNLLVQYRNGELEDYEILEYIEELLGECNKKEPNWQ